MATVNGIAVALFNAAAGGYAADMSKNPAAYAAAVGAILEKDLSSDAAFVEHLLSNFGVATTNAVYKDAQTALLGMVAGTGRANATVAAIDFLAGVSVSSPYAAVANAFAAKVATAAAFSTANAKELDVSKLIAAVTGVDTDVVATDAAFAAGAASRDKAVNDLTVEVAGLKAELAATQAAAAAAATKAAADAAAAKAAADAAAAKAAEDLAAANATITLIDDTAFASESAAAAAAKTAAEAVAAADAAAAKTAADAALAAKTAELAAANAQITALQNPAGGNFVLTTDSNTATTALDSDTILGIAGGDDSITGTNLTLLSGDIIVDGSQSDNDTLTLNVTAAPATSPTVVANIENVVFNVTSFATPTLSASGFTGTNNYTINNLQASGASDATFTAVSTGATVNAGSGVTGTLSVTPNTDASVTVNGGTATTVTVATVGTGAAVIAGGASTTSATGTATTGSVTITGAALAGSTAATATGKTLSVTLDTVGTTTAGNTIALTGVGTADAATVSAAGLVALNVDATNGNTKIETINLSGNGAAVTYTPDALAITTSVTMSGSQDVTLVGDEALLDGLTLTDRTTAGTTTFKITNTVASDSDLVDVGVDVIEQNGAIAAAGVTYSFGSNAHLKVSAAQTQVITLATAGTTATTGVTTDSISVTASNAATVLITSDSTTAATETAFNTVNFSVDTAATTLTAILGATTGNLNISGNKQVTLHTSSTANAVNASSLTGALIATASATTTDNIIAGSGNDVITTASGAVVTLNGGTGTNTLKVQGDMSSVDFTNFGTITLDAAVTTADASQLSGKSYVVTAAGATAFSFGTTAANYDTTTIDLSLLTNNNVSGYTVDLSNGLSTALFTSTTGATVVGTSLADTINGTANADSLSGGNGDNVIDGNAGADTITTGTGADTIYGGNGADVISSGTGIDIVYGGGDAATKESTTAVITGLTFAAADTITVTAFGKAITHTVPGTAGADADDAVGAAIVAAVNGDAIVGKLVTATYTAGSDTLTVTSKVDGALTDFAFAFVTAANADTWTSGPTATNGVAGSDGIDTITLGTGADFVISGLGADVINLGAADAAADSVILYLATDGGDVISNFEAGATGGDIVYVSGAMVANGNPSQTLASVTSTGTVGANDIFVEITTATAAGGADAASEIATFLANLTMTNVANTDMVVFAVNDGSDTYLWHMTENGTATGVSSGELALIAKLVGVTDIANGDLAFIA